VKDERYRRHNELVNKTLLYLHANFTGRYWSNPTGAVETKNGHFQRYGLLGSTDIIGFTGQGRAVFIEIKTGYGVLSKQQKMFKDVAVNNGCVHIVIYDEIDDTIFINLQRRKNGTDTGTDCP
jgi:hypothetical protein